MGYVLRFWKCRKCDRPNKTFITPNGTVKCEACADVIRIEPIPARMIETAGQPDRLAR
jgi:translation initiation factor 2 beta subunit (eIF-2beta)/eIF-5